MSSRGKAGSKLSSDPSCFPPLPPRAGFKSLIESDTFPKGLDEDVVRAISAKKKEPEWMLEFRLKAYRKWLTMVGAGRATRGAALHSSC